MHLFISYSRQDKTCADQIMKDLEAEGYKVWRDTQSIPPGTTSWTKAIQNGIQESLAFILIWSANASSSEWVEREIAYALFLKTRVFVVRLDYTEMPLALFTHQPLETPTCANTVSRLTPYLPPVEGSTLHRIKLLLSSSDPAGQEEALRLATVLTKSGENCGELLQLFQDFGKELNTTAVKEVNKLLEDCLNAVNAASDVLKARCSFCFRISEYNKHDICGDHREIFMRGGREMMLTCLECGKAFIVEFDCEERHDK